MVLQHQHHKYGLPKYLQPYTIDSCVYENGTVQTQIRHCQWWYSIHNLEHWEHTPLQGLIPLLSRILDRCEHSDHTFKPSGSQGLVRCPPNLLRVKYLLCGCVAISAGLTSTGMYKVLGAKANFLNCQLTHSRTRNKYKSTGAFGNTQKSCNSEWFQNNSQLATQQQRSVRYSNFQVISKYFLLRIYSVLLSFTQPCSA